MQFVATSKPDGYTLLLALSSISIIPEADKIFDRRPAFTVDQFAPIALISADPTILVVRAESPWKTARDFIDDAKKRSGQISYSSSGIYGTLHMAMELLSHAAGIRLKHVPHTGGGPAMTALLGVALLLVLLNLYAFVRRGLDWRARLALAEKGEETS